MPSVYRPRLKAATWACLILPALVAEAAADEWASEHGKVNTADATPVGARVLELELSYAPSWAWRRGWGSFEDSPAAYEHMLGLSATWGPTDDLDLSLKSGYGFVHEASEGDHPGIEDGHGHGDAAISARYRFYSTKELDLAAITGFVLPTGADASPGEQLGISQAHFSWDGAVVASSDAGAATANLELGLEVPMGSGRKDLRGVGLANLAGGYHIATWLQPEVELNYQHIFADGPDADLLAATLGVVVPWGAGHRLTAGLQQAVWGHGIPAFTAASMAYKAAF
ncbi:hypothetical protein ACFL5O_04710 [Myxococcota bacterium]